MNLKQFISNFDIHIVATLFSVEVKIFSAILVPCVPDNMATQSVIPKDNGNLKTFTQDIKFLIKHGNLFNLLVPELFF